MFLSFPVWFTPLRARELDAAIFRSFAGAAATLRGVFRYPVFRWSVPAFANTPQPVLPQNGKFSFYGVLALYQPFEISQILLQPE